MGDESNSRIDQTSHEYMLINHDKLNTTLLSALLNEWENHELAASDVGNLRKNAAIKNVNYLLDFRHK